VVGNLVGNVVGANWQRPAVRPGADGAVFPLQICYPRYFRDQLTGAPAGSCGIFRRTARLGQH
jgi:hypothetical protein